MLHRVLLVLLFLIFAILFVLYSLSGEDICLFYPEIDTIFAPNFSKEKFKKIQIGMSKQDVRRIAGDPLGVSVSRCGEFVEEWGYSRDGTLGAFGDKAWFYYCVIFIDGAVAAKNVKVYYD